jgi:uncharacterized membrane protein
MLFISYSFLGWCIEVILKFIQYKRFINRGFLIGPWLPIYGWGALLITILLQKYSNDPIALFALGMIICAILEYFTSYLLEKIFKARWWDYSTKKFNINGRVCLETMIPFGLCGLLIIYYTNPFFLYIYSLLNDNVLKIICLIILIIFIIDNVLSFNLLFLIRKDTKLLEKDNTEELFNIRKKIKSKELLLRRLLNAFPSFSIITNLIEKSHDIIKKKDKK